MEVNDDCCCTGGILLALDVAGVESACLGGEVLLIPDNALVTTGGPIKVSP